MCDPTALIGAQAGGAAYSAVGAYYNAKVQKSTLDAQAALDDVNAHMSELSAQSTLLAGQRSEQASRLNTAALKSTQKNNIAANGLDLSGSPTATAILTSTDVIGEVDANTIATNAVSQAWGYRMQGVNSSNDALIKRASAGAISPLAAGFTSLITSAGSIAQNKAILSKYGGGTDTVQTPSTTSTSLTGGGWGDLSGGFSIPKLSW